VNFSNAYHSSLFFDIWIFKVLAEFSCGRLKEPPPGLPGGGVR